MYHGPFVQTDLVRRTASASAIATPLAWVHFFIAVAAFLALIAAMYALTPRKRTDWK